MSLYSKVVQLPPASSLDSQVSVAVTSGVLLAARADRMRCVYLNTDAANPIYINFSNGAATTGNFKLAAGQSVEQKGAGATKAIATGGTVTVCCMEEYGF